MSSRFVILFHAVPIGSDRRDHWDLMLECPNSENRDKSDDARVLNTWALESEPMVGKKILAMELPDHRRAFLTFEGPLSNDRGEVKRHFGGEMAWISNSPDLKLVELLLPETSWLLKIQRVRDKEFEVEVTAKSHPKTG